MIHEFGLQATPRHHQSSEYGLLSSPPEARELSETDENIEQLI